MLVFDCELSGFGRKQTRVLRMQLDRAARRHCALQIAEGVSRLSSKLAPLCCVNEASTKLDPWNCPPQGLARGLGDFAAVSPARAGR